MTTTSVHETSLAAALEALAIPSGTSYAWMGETVALPASVVRHADPRGVRDALVQGVASQLYASFYTTGAPVPASPRTADASAYRALSHALTAANSGTGCVEPGWRIIGREGARWIVERAGLRLWARGNDLVVDGPAEPAPGEMVAVRLPSDAPEMCRGFYLALGDRGFSAEGGRGLDRFYLDLREDGAIDFVLLATRGLNREGLAFRAKVVDEPGAFDRCDSALLLTERRERARALAAVLAVHGALIDRLDPAVPALTRPLAPGLAFAEDPGSGESFGAHRCRLIAEAVVAANERGVDDLGGRLDGVRDRFVREGLSLETPYLGPDSTGDLA